jgi:thiamine biosynthesis lipoprotein
MTKPQQHRAGQQPQQPPIINLLKRKVMAVEKFFRAMGTDVHIVINGPKDELETACELVTYYENLWSRFISTSEISRMNAYGGQWHDVSTATASLVSHALEGFKLTDGVFDPTVFGDMMALGYGKSFEMLSPQVKLGTSRYIHDAERIAVERNRVFIPQNVGFDPGGIGKGFAADLIAEEMMTRDVDGIAVNLGGDIRVAGIPLSGDAWSLAIKDADNLQLDVVAIVDGALATSTIKKRTWTTEDGNHHHHIIDPRTRKSAATSFHTASAICKYGWQAEILSKCALIDGEKAFSIGDNLDAAVALWDNGHQTSSSLWDRFHMKETI